MAQACPICDTVNDESALECDRCGKQLLTEAQLEETIQPIEGLEETSVLEDTRFTPEGDPMEDVEATLQAPVEIVEVERIAIEPTLQAAAGEVDAGPAPADYDSGRDHDDEPRAQAPSTDECPWPACGEISPSPICPKCGRRKGRYSAAPVATAVAVDPRRQMPTVRCPACLGRVIWDVRCSECGVPMLPLE